MSFIDIPEKLSTEKYVVKSDFYDIIVKKKITEIYMSGKKKKIIYSLAAVVLVLGILTGWTLWGNTALMVNTYEIKSDKLPEAFDGFRIAQISDLHNAVFGEGNKELIELLQKTEPDIIAITGDMIDGEKTDIGVALAFAEEAMKIAPCYYVAGNHEWKIDNYNELFTGLEKLGVLLLNDGRTEIEKGGEKITVLGVDDPYFHTNTESGTDREPGIVDSELQGLMSEVKGYSILLSHRPELFDIYVKNDIDLVLSGHAHGGQFRLPFMGGVIAPHQGFFPEYDAGLFTEDGTNLIISRGIGNSVIPLRFNNRPEIVVAELVAE